MTSSIPALLGGLIAAGRERPEPIADASWKPLLALARTTDVEGLVACRALASGMVLPAAVAGRLTEQRQLEARHRGFHFVEAERVASALGAAGIRAALLKGAALARTVYDDPAERSFRDLDVLVPREDLERAIDCLGRLEYQLADPPEVRQAQLAHHFHVALAGSGRPRIELHWALVRPDDPYRLDAELVLEGATAPDAVPAFPCPRAEAQVLHAVVSQLRCGFTQLKRLVDVDRLVRAAEPIGWDRVASYAAANGLGPALRLLLELTAALFGTPLVEPLRLVPPLGSVRRRLDELGIDGFPLAAPPSAWGPARHLVRFWLSGDRRLVARQFLFRPRFDQARLVALGVPRHRRAASTLKRALIVAYVALWQLALRMRGHSPSRLPSLV